MHTFKLGPISSTVTQNRVKNPTAINPTLPVRCPFPGQLFYNIELFFSYFLSRIVIFSAFPRPQSKHRDDALTLWGTLVIYTAGFL
jgi:hypothetical protein